MGRDKKPAALSLADAALARQTARLVGDQVRAALYEHRMIRSGQHRELTADEAAALGSDL